MNVDTSGPVSVMPATGCTALSERSPTQRGITGLKRVLIIATFVLAAGIGTFLLTKPSGTAYRPGDVIPNTLGVENVVVFSRHVLSGSQPEGEVGFNTLRDLGIKAIVCVDATRPEIELAEARGMQYVHVPLKYDGIDGPQRVAIAKALKDLPKPIYVHCHHGKHRGPAATAIGLVCLGEASANEAVQLMRTAGTSEHYSELFDHVGSAVKLGSNVLEAAAMPPAFVEITGLNASMVEINQSFKEIRLIGDNGWETPVDHPDIELEHAAPRLPDLFRSLADELDRPENTGVNADYRALMHEAADQAARLELAIEQEDWTLADELRGSVAQSCVRCHDTYR